MQPAEQQHDRELRNLATTLRDAGISINEWGRGQAKTLRHLASEIAAGETVLEHDDQGHLVRKVVVGGADVYYRSPEGVLFRLREARQVFKDGRERQRDLGHAVAEKMKPDENPEQAMIRGIEEELGICGPLELEDLGTSEQTIESPSYPGLKSQYIQHKFRVTLSDDQYDPDGYAEEQTDKTTYFEWNRAAEES